MNFLKRFFNRRIKMLGRAGIIYKDDTDTYFIDSEALAGPPDVVIFTKGIRFFHEHKRAQILSDEEKKAIAQKVKSELESMGMSAKLS